MQRIRVPVIPSTRPIHWKAVGIDCDTTESTTTRIMIRVFITAVVGPCGAFSTLKAYTANVAPDNEPRPAKNP